MNLKSLLLKISDSIAESIFPINCLGCGQGKEYICEKCLKKIPLRVEQVCPICEKVNTPDGRTCFDCKRKYSIDGVLAASSYQIEAISHSIHLFKYGFIEKFQSPLGKILLKSLINSNLPLPDLIIPIPLHPRRLRWRGFNQAQLLADFLGNNLIPGFSIPVENEILIRKKFTKPQMKIKDSLSRKLNIQNVFIIKKDAKKSIKEKRIYLVDDISTTGSTLFECAKILKKAGTKEVFGIVLARQGY